MYSIIPWGNQVEHVEVTSFLFILLLSHYYWVLNAHFIAVVNNALAFQSHNQPYFKSGSKADCAACTAPNSNRRGPLSNPLPASGHEFFNAGNGMQNNNLGCGNQYNAGIMIFGDHNCPYCKVLFVAKTSQQPEGCLHRNLSDFQCDIERNRMFLKGTILRVMLKRQLGLFLFKCTLLLVIAVIPNICMPDEYPGLFRSFITLSLSVNTGREDE
ncbi:hypothetical protein V8E54_009533 [Elaphomyces granulatus]